MNDENAALAKELGFDQLSEETQVRQLKNFYQTLHLRVAMALEDALTDEQLEEFGKVSDKGGEAALDVWFKQAVPNYEQIVAEQTEALKRDIQQDADHIRSIIDEAD